MEVLAIYARTSVDKSENSTIDQQIKAGIEFANNNSMKHKIFQDRGISGYKIEEDEEKKTFANRPGLVKMIDEIENGKIDSVWIWEHSRISRNQYVSFFISKIFFKYKIKLYEKDREYDLNDPNTKLIRGMLDAVAEYERQLIVMRTTRGLYNAIDNGKRSYTSLFGYRKTIKNEKGNFIWEPVESELLQVKNWFYKYKNGESLKNIVFSQNSSEGKTRHILKRTTHLSRTLQHYIYTGYTLNTRG